jgi:rod shape-determining protein MreD
MRNAWFFAVGFGLLVVQANVFRAMDGVGPGIAAALWVLALAMDVATTARTLRGAAGRPRPIGVFRAEWSLMATVLLAYVLLVSVAHAHVARPIPAVALPLILFMGVHEYSLPRGAAVAFALGYATDVLGIAPVGLYTFTYVATFVLARAAGVRLAAQTSWMQVLLVGAFTILQSTMVLILLAIFGRDAWVPKALFPLILPHVIATAATAPLLFRVAQTLHTAAAGSTGATRAEAGVGTAP